MSASNNSRLDGNKGFPKTQKKFVQNWTPKDHPNPTTSTLSASLRHLSSDVVPSTSKVQMGANGDRARAAKFVYYLPQDEAVASGLGADEGGLDPVESQRVVDLLNRELSRLLKLNPREFWRQVASDTSLHEFLDSFLQFRRRWYDFPYHGAKGIVAGIIVGEAELSCRVFMVLYRISSNKDPGARTSDSLSAKDHGVLLQEKKLLDLPKLLDICAIYGHENEELTRLLVGNAMNAQPKMHDNLTAVLYHFLNIVHTMNERCSSSLEVSFVRGSHGDLQSSRLHSDYLEVMDFINDAIVSMDALVTAYRPSSVYFSCPVEMSYGNEELIITLVRLHDSLLSSLQRGFRTIFTGKEDEKISKIAVSLKMLSMRLVKFGWKLLDSCYLSDEVFEDSLPIPDATKMFPAKVEDPFVRADILVQTFREMNGVSVHPLETQNRLTFLQNVEKSFNLLSQLESLQSAGWIYMEDEQFQYLSGIMTSQNAKVRELPTVPAPVNVQLNEDVAIIESKISQIKDIFPDYGKGFLAACLEAYNRNPEEIIQRILEGTLHEDIKALDTSMEIMPAPKSTSTVSRNMNDKGKGILVESSQPPAANKMAMVGKPQNEGPSVTPASPSLGRYVRKPSADLPSSAAILDTRDEKDLVRTAAIASQYEYDDEYDDSFDDLGLSVGESVLEENEMISLSKSWGAGTENSAQSASNSKWGSKKTPQYYVRDGKNYSYKVAGSVAVADANEAALMNQTHSEMIHGLGRGGNLPVGAVAKLEKYVEQNNKSDVPETAGRGNAKGRGWGRGKSNEEQTSRQSDGSGMEGRGWGRGKSHEELTSRQADGSGMEGRGNPRGSGRGRGRSNEDQAEAANGSEMEGRGSMGSPRGSRGRRGGGRNHNRKDQATKKHFSGLTGF